MKRHPDLSELSYLFKTPEHLSLLSLAQLHELSQLITPV